MGGAVLAAALTLWSMFAVWLIAPHAGLPARVVRTAVALGATELAALMLASYGAQECGFAACAVAARTAGTAARVDIPALAAAFVLAAAAGLAWRGRHPLPARG